MIEKKAMKLGGLFFMDEKKLWQKISGSITYYLNSYDREKSNEELLEDYLLMKNY